MQQFEGKQKSIDNFFTSALSKPECKDRGSNRRAERTNVCGHTDVFTWLNKVFKVEQPNTEQKPCFKSTAQG